MQEERTYIHTHLLCAHKRCIHAVVGEQCRMLPDLSNAPLMHHHRHVGGAHRAQAADIRVGRQGSQRMPTRHALLLCRGTHTKDVPQNSAHAKHARRQYTHRCAMMMTVHRMSLIARWMASVTATSEWASSALVASSRISILGRRSSARARAMR